VLLATIRFGVPEIVTGLIGVGFIGAALLSSVVRNARSAEEETNDSAAVLVRGA